MGRLAAHDLFAWRDACAIDEAVDAAECVERGSHGGLPVGFTGDIGRLETRRSAQFVRQRGAGITIDVQQHRLAACRDDHACYRGAEAGSRTRDQKYPIGDIHLHSVFK